MPNYVTMGQLTSFSRRHRASGMGDPAQLENQASQLRASANAQTQQALAFRSQAQAYQNMGNQAAADSYNAQADNADGAAANMNAQAQRLEDQASSERNDARIAQVTSVGLQIGTGLAPLFTSIFTPTPKAPATTSATSTRPTYAPYTPYTPYRPPVTQSIAPPGMDMNTKVLIGVGALAFLLLLSRR